MKLGLPGLMGLVSTMSIIPVSADPGNQTPLDERKVIVLPKTPTTHRPKAPSMQHIECVYSGGSLSFEFAIPEGNCILTLTDNISGQVISADFNSDAPASVYVGYHESANISIISAQGNTYTGTW